MCGICGVIHFDGKPVTRELLTGMNETLRHRGPDGDGYYIDGAVGFAMRRLKIIDVAGSDQPLYNEDGSIALSLQRGDLQLSRVAAGAGGARASLQDRGRWRDDRASL